MNPHQRKALERLLRPGECLDLSEFPWPCPKKGDLVRALCLLDDDPQNVKGNGFDSIHRACSNCVVWNVEQSATPGSVCVYYDDNEGLPIPVRHSPHEYGNWSTWGNVEFWRERCEGLTDVIPMSAIKPSLLGEYAEKLKRRAEGIENGLFP